MRAKVLWQGVAANTALQERALCLASGSIRTHGDKAQHSGAASSRWRCSGTFSAPTGAVLAGRDVQLRALDDEAALGASPGHVGTAEAKLNGRYRGG